MPPRTPGATGEPGCDLIWTFSIVLHKVMKEYSIFPVQSKYRQQFGNAPIKLYADLQSSYTLEEHSSRRRCSQVINAVTDSCTVHVASHCMSLWPHLVDPFSWIPLQYEWTNWDEQERYSESFFIHCWSESHIMSCRLLLKSSILSAVLNNVNTFSFTIEMLVTKQSAVLMGWGSLIIRACPYDRS